MAAKTPIWAGIFEGVAKGLNNYEKNRLDRKQQEKKTETSTETKKEDKNIPPAHSLYEDQRKQKTELSTDTERVGGSLFPAPSLHTEVRKTRPVFLGTRLDPASEPMESAMPKSDALLRGIMERRTAPVRTSYSSSEPPLRPQQTTSPVQERMLAKAERALSARGLSPGGGHAGPTSGYGPLQFASSPLRDSAPAPGMRRSAPGNTQRPRPSQSYGPDTAETAASPPSKTVRVRFPDGSVKPFENVDYVRLVSALGKATADDVWHERPIRRLG